MELYHFIFYFLQMNFLTLPDETKQMIYQYDSTYHEIYKKMISELNIKYHRIYRFYCEDLQFDESEFPEIFLDVWFENETYPTMEKENSSIKYLEWMSMSCFVSILFYFILSSN